MDNSHIDNWTVANPFADRYGWTTGNSYRVDSWGNQTSTADRMESSRAFQRLQHEMNTGSMEALDDLDIMHIVRDGFRAMEHQSASDHAMIVRLEQRIEFLHETMKAKAMAFFKAFEVLDELVDDQTARQILLILREAFVADVT